MKRLLVYLLLVTLTLSLLGCDAEPADPITTGQITPSSTTAPTQTSTPKNNDTFSGVSQSFSLFPENSNGNGSSTSAEISVQHIPLTVDNPDNLPVLKWVCLVDGDYGAYKGRKWSSTAVEELNQMLADRNMPFRVQFKLVTTDQATNDWFLRGNIGRLIEDADLIYGFADQQSLQTYFAPITQYITGDTQQSLANAVPHEKNWIGTKIGEEIYGIPTKPELVLGNGWWIDTEFLNACGLKAEDLSRNFWEMDDIFEKIYKQNANKPFLYYDGDGYQTQTTKHGILQALPLGGICDAIDNTNYQPIGGSFGIDLTGEKPMVVDILATDTVRNIREAYLRYRAAGYVTSNYGAEKLRYDLTYGSEPYRMDGMTVIPVSETMIHGETSNHVTGIAKGSQHQQEAVSLLELIAEDEEFRMQLFYGKEGRDYKLEDGVYTLIPNAVGSVYSLDMVSPLAYFSGLVGNDTTLFHSPSTRPLYFAHEGKTTLESYRDNMDAVSYCHYPIVFDYSGFEEELNAIAGVMGTYYYSFTLPNMKEDDYDRMLQKMEDAGSKKIITQLQQQLDAWLAENPDWQ